VLVIEVPAGVTTVISTDPVPAGELTVQIMSVAHETEVPGVAPKLIALTALEPPPLKKPVP
jgi:hypothetical protein